MPAAKHRFNTHLLLDAAGHIAASYRKIHLFDLDIPGKVEYPAPLMARRPGLLQEERIRPSAPGPEKRIRERSCMAMWKGSALLREAGCCEWPAHHVCSRCV